MSVVLRPIEPADVDALQELIEADPGYTERITGYPPGPADAQSLLLMRPEGLPEDAKLVLGGFVANRLVAVVDLIRGYPNDQTAFIGLLQVHWNHQGLGYGRATYEQVQRYVETTWPGVRTLRLAIVDTNAKVATRFWLQQGFTPTGEERPYRYDKLESSTRLYEKQLTWAHPSLVVRDSPVAGRGLFATEPIAQGAVVGQLSGRRVSTAELRELLKHPAVDTITIDDDEHLVLSNDPRPVIAYGNHSCDPNMWWIDAVTLEARRDIAAGDEVTSDYGTSTGVDYELQCTCGSPLCRGVVTGEDWKSPELQSRYGDHWIPELLRKQRGG